MRPIDRLLDRLQAVRRSHNGHTARCPAHEDRTASLSVREVDGGKVLIHCFAGCEVADVVAAIGLAVSDLFPPRENVPAMHARPGPTISDWRAALNVLDREAAIVEIAARDLRQWEVLDVADMARLGEAVQRISDARRVLCVR